VSQVFVSARDHPWGRRPRGFGPSDARADGGDRARNANPRQLSHRRGVRHGHAEERQGWEAYGGRALGAVASRAPGKPARRPRRSRRLTGDGASEPGPDLRQARAPARWGAILRKQPAAPAGDGGGTFGRHLRVSSEKAALGLAGRRSATFAHFGRSLFGPGTRGGAPASPPCSNAFLDCEAPAHGRCPRNGGRVSPAAAPWAVSWRRLLQAGARAPRPRLGRSGGSRARAPRADCSRASVPLLSPRRARGACRRVLGGPAGSRELGARPGREAVTFRLGKGADGPTSPGLHPPRPALFGAGRKDRPL